jgi:hypothetical protein
MARLVALLAITISCHVKISPIAFCGKYEGKK